MKSLIVLVSFFAMGASAQVAPAYLQCDFFNLPLLVDVTMPKTFGIGTNNTVVKLPENPTEFATSIEPIEIRLPNGLVYKSQANAWIFTLYFKPDARGANAKYTASEYRKRGITLFEGRPSVGIPVIDQYGFLATLRAKVINGTLVPYDLNPQPGLESSQTCYFKN